MSLRVPRRIPIFGCAICVIFWMVPIDAVHANPRIEWTDSTRLALAQALVGEAGWDKRTEWAAIAHVLLKRWSVSRVHESFESRVRRYCAVHRTRRPTSRQLWVRNLPWGELVEDPGLENGVDWRNYRARWRRARAFVFEFEMGLITDPIPAARYFASRQDISRRLTTVAITIFPNIVPDIDTGTPVRLQNRFYRIDHRRRGPVTGTGTAPEGRILDAADAV